jgi:hypothetical protein
MEPLAKSTFAHNCHSERSEESCTCKGLIFLHFVQDDKANTCAKASKIFTLPYL